MKRVTSIYSRTAEEKTASGTLSRKPSAQAVAFVPFLDTTFTKEAKRKITTPEACTIVKRMHVTDALKSIITEAAADAINAADTYALTEAVDGIINLKEAEEISKFRRHCLELEAAHNAADAKTEAGIIAEYVKTLDLADASASAVIRKCVQKTGSRYFIALQAALTSAINDSKNQLCAAALVKDAEAIAETAKKRDRISKAILSINKQIEQLEAMEEAEEAAAEKIDSLVIGRRKLLVEREALTEEIKRNKEYAAFYFMDEKNKAELYTFACDIIAEARKCIAEAINAADKDGAPLNFENDITVRTIRRVERPQWEEVKESDYSHKTMKLIQKVFRNIRSYIYSVSTPRLLTDSINRIADTMNISAEAAADVLLYEHVKDGALIGSEDKYGIVTVSGEDVKKVHSFINEMKLTPAQLNVLDEMRYSFIAPRERKSARLIAEDFDVNHNAINKHIVNIMKAARRVVVDRITQGTATAQMIAIYNATADVHGTDGKKENVYPRIGRRHVLNGEEIQEVTVWREYTAITEKGGKRRPLMLPISGARIVTPEVQAQAEAREKAIRKAAKKEEKERRKACKEAEEKRKAEAEKARKLAAIRNRYNWRRMEAHNYKAEAVRHYRAADYKVSGAKIVKHGIYLYSPFTKKEAVNVPCIVKKEYRGMTLTIKGVKRIIVEKPLRLHIKGARIEKVEAVRHYSGKAMTIKGVKLKVTEAMTIKEAVNVVNIGTASARRGNELVLNCYTINGAKKVEAVRHYSGKAMTIKGVKRVSKRVTMVTKNG